MPVLTEHPPIPATLAILYAYRRTVPPEVLPFADMLVTMPAATAMTRSPALDRYNPNPGGRGPFADLFRAMRRAARGNNGVVVAAQSVEHQV